MQMNFVKFPQWVVPVTLVALLMGFLLVSSHLSYSPRTDGAPRVYGAPEGRGAGASLARSLDEKDSEINKLREEITRLQNALANQSRQAKVLNESLQEAKLLAGLTEVEGPGVEIILKDSEKQSDNPWQYVIHDDDVIRVVNELWLAGAEAIAVNSQRISITTAFRCEGPVIYVGRVPISSPVVIRAIGDPETLMGALNMPGRYLNEIRSVDPKMVEIHKRYKMVLPAYTGSTEFRHAKSTVPKQ